MKKTFLHFVNFVRTHIPSFPGFLRGNPRGIHGYGMDRPRICDANSGDANSGDDGRWMKRAFYHFGIFIPLTQLRVRLGLCLANPAHPSPQGRGWLSQRRSRVRGICTLLLSVFCLLATASAHAACTNPVGSAGDVYYNEQWRVPQYCNDTAWVTMRPAFSGDALDNGLVGHWKLDETSGATINDSAGSNNGTWTDAVNNDVTEETANGYVDTSITFDGANDYVRVTNAASIDADNFTGMTVSAWIYPQTDGEAGEGRIVDKSDNSAARNGWRFTISDSGSCCNRLKFDGEFATTDMTRRTNTNAITLNEWQHVLATWDMGTDYTNVHIYVNGVEASYDFGVDGDGGFTDSQNLNIGNNTNGGRTFDGPIDDTRVYNRILSQKEITQLASMGPDPTRGLVGHWKLDEGTGTTAVDVGSATNDGTYTNSPTQSGGLIGGALEFSGDTGADATNDRVDIGDPGDGSLDFGSGSFSYGMWVYAPNNAGSFDMPWWKGGSSAGSAGYDMELGTGNWASGISDGDENEVLSFNGAPINDQWVHLFAVIDRSSDTHYVYVDGAEWDTNAMSGTFGSVSSSSPASIGALSTGQFPFLGKIDDVRVYDRALAPTEIAVIYGCTSPVGQRGAFVYNDDQNVMQYCDGEAWHAMGPNPGTGGAGCTNPARDEGVMIYNSDFNMMQYCDGAKWVAIGRFCSGGTTDGLIAHWKFEDGTGSTTANDYSANSNTGLLTSMDPATDWIPGIRGGALDFDGSDDKIIATDFADQLSAAAGTISFWANIDSIFPSNEYFFSASGANSHDPSIYRNTSDGKFRLVMNAVNSISTTTMAEDTWYHVAGTWDATTQRLYINGVEEDNDGVGTISPSGNTHLMGYNSGDNSNFRPDGMLDDMRVYDRALSAAEIAELSQASACPQTTADLDGAPISVARVQSQISTSTNPASVTLASTPVEGNLLVAIAAGRADSGDNSISGTGWTQHVYFDALSGNATNRRNLAIWSKIAGAAEPTAITTDISNGSSRLIVQEFAITGGTVAFDVTAETQGGTVDVTSISSGTTAASATADSLVITGLVTRDAPATAPTWTNGVANELGDTASGSIGIYTGYSHDTSAGAKESTASWTTARDASAAVVVFSITP